MGKTLSYPESMWTALLLSLIHIYAVELAARLFREGKRIPKENGQWKVGERVHRLDVREKVLGTGEYTDDIEMEGMLFASAVRSEYARAKVLSVDGSKALAVPGVKAVITAKDIPGNVRTGHLKRCLLYTSRCV